ncbi:MAG TPA: D-cysteine desulfhydrase [Vicinamibacteria bacterium]|nr:D-cysteine desulfhydrase [Vicinamibacteria bacterium]
MNLSRFPRRRYTQGWTPIEKLDRLSAELRGPAVYVKRDDLLGLAAGGNKTRKLEFIVADAIEKGADSLVTGGAIQSNHCRLTLAAAVKEGLRCHLVLEERVPGTYDPQASGNNFLYQLLGASSIKVVPGGSNMMKELELVAAQLKAEGKAPYVIPVGASNSIGATGYAACAQEIVSQAFDSGLRIDRVVTASGSSGTHAGLVTGFHGLSSGIRVIGINVSRPKEPQEDLVYSLARETARRIGIHGELPREAVLCFGDYVGPGYSRPTPEMGEAVRMLARLEAILLDPVYTGKAMAGLIDLIRKNHFESRENVLFVHTGGSPALYAYRNDVLD